MNIDTRARLLVGVVALGLLAACGPGGGVYVGVAVPGPYGGPYPYPGYIGPPPMVYSGGRYEEDALNDAGPPLPATRVATTAPAKVPQNDQGSLSTGERELQTDVKSEVERD